MYSKYQLYQCFYFPFMVVASLHFAGTPQAVAAQEAQYDVAKTSEAAASQVTQNNNEKKPYDVIKENKWTLAVVGTFLGVVGLWWVINKNAKGDGDEVRIEGDTSLIGDYVFISDEKGKNKSFMHILYISWKKFSDAFCNGEELDVELGPEVNKEQAREFVNNLNKTAIQDTQKDYEENPNYVIETGEWKDVIGRFNTKAEKLDPSLQIKKDKFLDDDVVAVTAAKLDIQLNEEFHTKELVVDGTKVEAYGIEKGGEKSEELVKNIREVVYKPKGRLATKDESQCIIEVGVKNKDFRLFFVDGFKGKLKEAMNKINTHTEENKEFTDKDEISEEVLLTIPKIKGTFESHFQSIFKGATVRVNDGEIRLLKVYQKTSISMDEKGVKVLSKAAVVGSRGGGPSKHYEFNRQFFMILIPKGGKRAETILDVDGTDLMTKVK